jgi:hypothetical protein
MANMDLRLPAARPILGTWSIAGTLPSIRPITLIIWQDRVLAGKCGLPHTPGRVLTVARLTAIMLGRLRMSVEEVQQAYRVFSTSVFGHSRWFHERSILYCPRSKYATRKARRAMLAVIRDKLNQGRAVPLVDYRIEHEPLESPEHMCRTFVTITNVQSSYADDIQNGCCTFQIEKRRRRDALSLA